MDELSCDQITRLYWEYSRGFLDETSKLQIQNHISSCGMCRDYIEIMERVDRLLAQTKPNPLVKELLLDTPESSVPFQKNRFS